MDATVLKEMKFRGPVRFLDGRKGMAQQDFEAVDNPRFGYSWRREDRKDRGRQFYTVDGKEVANLEEAAKLLAVPPDLESPHEVYKRRVDEFKASPKLTYGASRAQNEAEMNASAGPFGTVRAWMQRAGHAYHVGINRYADTQRQEGFDSYRWLYDAKSGAHEAYRLIYLFESDRKENTGMVCALGKRCRECPILQTIERAMIEERDNPKWPRGIEDDDIAAAKAWTCIMHVMHEKAHPIDGTFIANKNDREMAADEAERWAEVARYSERGA